MQNTRNLIINQDLFQLNSDQNTIIVDASPTPLDTDLSPRDREINETLYGT